MAIQFDDLKKVFDENRTEIGLMIEAGRDALFNSIKMKILKARFLEPFWDSRLNKNLPFVIYFDEAAASAVDFGNIKQNLDGPITERLKTQRVILVDNAFNIISSEETKTKKDYLLSLSKKNIVIFFGEDGIDFFIREHDLTRINVFYDESDRRVYKKLYHISQLAECLREYQKYIHEPGINEAFFASHKLIAKIKPTNTPRNILSNKPEKLLRDNLLSFLTRNTQHDYLKEIELNSKRELDLYTEDEGKKYLIEVKWLGQSVNDEETDLTQRVTDVSAREGVVQTLEYIQELMEKMNYNLHTGYLCVFDARDNKKDVNYQSFTFIPPELQPYYAKHFIKLDEIPLGRN